MAHVPRARRARRAQAATPVPAPAAMHQGAAGPSAHVMWLGRKWCASTCPSCGWEETTSLIKEQCGWMEGRSRSAGQLGAFRGARYGRTRSISKSLLNQLGIHLFLAKQKKLCSNSLTSNLANFSNLTNLPPPRAYLRAEREHAWLAHPASRAYLSGALRFLAGLFVRLADLFLFYQVQMTNSRVHFFTCHIF
jgi:hypothetical protein